MGVDDTIYPGSFYELVRRFNRQRAPFKGAGASLPDADIDLTGLFEKPCDPPEPNWQALDRQNAARKKSELLNEFQGQPSVLALHAFVIACLRRNDPPVVAQILFHRLWSETGAQLAPLLTTRWKISTATTFAEHGNTATQKALGMGLSVVFDLIKLHENERRRSGMAPEQPFEPAKGTKLPRLGLGLGRYSFRGTGDLDRNMLSRLWLMSEEDPAIAPLAQSMLRMLVDDERTIFGRVQKIRTQFLNQ